MNPLNNLEEQIRRASRKRYNEHCKVLLQTIDIDALKRDVVNFITEYVANKTYIGITSDHRVYLDEDYRFRHDTRHLFDEVNSIFNGLYEQYESEAERLIDVIYSRPSDEELKEVYNYIKDGDIECSM